MKVVYTRLEQENAHYSFQSKEKELPQINQSDVLIQVKACKTLDIHTDVVKELFAKCPTSEIPAALEVAGVVTRRGGNVTSLEHGDRIAGFIPLTSEWSGCAEYCVLSEYDAVKLPDNIDYVVAVGMLGDALHAYTALQYMARLTVGDVVLILDGSTSWGRLAIQLAVMWGAKVITVISTLDEKSSLEKLASPPDHIIVNDGNTVTSHVMEETGGLGVDVVLDSGVCLFPRTSSEVEVDNPDRLSKHDIISMLAIGARWVTSCPHLQLDPPDCDQLLLHSATVSFLFSHTWILCPSKHGKLQHILRDFFTKLSEKKLEIPLFDCTSLTELFNSADVSHVLQAGTVISL